MTLDFQGCFQTKNSVVAKTSGGFLNWSTFLEFPLRGEKKASLKCIIEVRKI